MVNRNCGKGKVVFELKKGQYLELSLQSQKTSFDWQPTTECNHFAASVSLEIKAAHASPFPVPLF